MYIIKDERNNIVKAIKIIGYKGDYALLEVKVENDYDCGWKRDGLLDYDFKLEDNKYYWFVPIKNIESKMTIMDI